MTSAQESSAKTVIILGTNFLGELAAEELIKYTQFKILFAGQNRNILNKTAKLFPSRWTIKYLPKINKESLQKLFKEGNAVIATLQPERYPDLLILQSAMEAGIDYLDTSICKEYIEQVFNLHSKVRQNAISAFPGYSLGALSILMAKELEQHLDVIRDVALTHFFANSAPKSSELVRMILERLKNNVLFVEEGEQKTTKSWNKRYNFTFLEDTALKQIYDFDTVDSFFFLRNYPLRNYISKIGFETNIINYLLESSDWIMPVIKQFVVTLASWIEQKETLTQEQTKTSTTTGIRLLGAKWHKNTQVTASFSAPGQGHRIMIFPAALAVEYLLANKTTGKGVINPLLWIGAREFFAIAKERQFQYITQIKTV